MSKYENIKPYAEMVHNAAQHGGPKKWLDEMTEEAEQMGMLKEKATEPVKILITAGITLVGAKASSILWKKVKENNEEKIEFLKTKIHDKKERIVQFFNDMWR